MTSSWIKIEEESKNELDLDFKTETISNNEQETISDEKPELEPESSDKLESTIEQKCNNQQQPEIKVESKTNSETKIAGMSRNYYCVDCKSTTRNPRLYLQHRRDFHNEAISIHECELCVYASKHSQKLARHLRTVHRDVVQIMSVETGANSNLGHSSEIIPNGLQSMHTTKNVRLSTCKICGLFTVSKTVLMDHVRHEHPDVRIYECDQCDYSHYIRDRYNRHHRYHSMNHIRCQMCEFQTIYRWNLERHMRHHVNHFSLGFRCNKCNFTASTKQSITAHEIAHHSGPNSQIDTLQVIEPPITPATIVENEQQTNEDNWKNMEQDGGDFDASAFLTVVLDDADTQIEPENRDGPLENSAAIVSEQHNEKKSTTFYCRNCNFR